jgi:hypothetical protein
MSTPSIKEPGSLILSQQKVHAVNGYLDFLVKGKSKYKTIQDNKALNIFLRILTGLATVATGGTTILVAGAVDVVDGMICSRQNSEINKNIEKVFLAVTREANQKQRGLSENAKTTRDFEIQPAIRSLIQSIDKKVGKADFAKSLALYSDAVKLVEARAISDKALHKELRNNLTSELKAKFCKSMCEKLGKEIAASTPASVELVQKAAKDLKAFGGDSVGTEQSIANRINYIAQVTKGAALDTEIEEAQKLGREIVSDPNCKAVQEFKAKLLQEKTDVVQKAFDDVAAQLNEKKAALKAKSEATLKVLQGFLASSTISGLRREDVDNALRDPAAAESINLLKGIKVTNENKDALKQFIDDQAELNTLVDEVAKLENQYSELEKKLYLMGKKAETPAEIQKELRDANNKKIAALQAMKSASKPKDYEAANAPVVPSEIITSANKEALANIVKIIRDGTIPTEDVRKALVERQINALPLQVKAAIISQIEEDGIKRGETSRDAITAWDKEFAMHRAIPDYKGAGIVSDYSRLEAAIKAVEASKVYVA